MGEEMKLMVFQSFIEKWCYKCEYVNRYFGAKPCNICKVKKPSKFKKRVSKK